MWCLQLIIHNFVLKGVVLINRQDLWLKYGTYERVYAVNYCKTICAAKEVHYTLIQVLEEAEKKIIELFLWECHSYKVHILHQLVASCVYVYY